MLRPRPAKPAIKPENPAQPARENKFLSSFSPSIIHLLLHAPFYGAYPRAPHPLFMGTVLRHVRPHLPFSHTFFAKMKDLFAQSASKAKNRKGNPSDWVPPSGLPPPSRPRRDNPSLDSSLMEKRFTFTCSSSDELHCTEVTFLTMFYLYECR